MNLKYALLTGTFAAALALGGATQAQPYNGPMNGGMRNGMSNQIQGGMQERGSYSGNEQQGLSPRDVRQFMHNAQRTLTQGIESGNMQQLRQWTQRSIANDAVFSGNRSMQAHGITKSISAMTFSKPDLLALESLGNGNGPGMLGIIRNYNVNIHVLNMRPVGQGAAMVRVRITQSRTLGGNNEESQSQQSGDQQSQNWQEEGQLGTNGMSGANGALASAGSNQSGQSYAGQGSANEETVGQGGGQEYGGGSGYGQQQNWSGNGSGGVQLRTDATCDYLLERNQNGGQVQIAMGICSGKTQTPF